MNQADRDELKRMEAAATPGPWFSDGDDVDENADSPYLFTKIDPALLGGMDDAVHVLFEADWGTKEDAEFIASLRNSAPDILAEIEMMRKLLGDAKEALRLCYQVTDYPADGKSDQEVTLRNIESFLSERP